MKLTYICNVGSRPANYGGQAAPPPHVTEPDEEPLLMPTMNFGQRDTNNDNAVTYGGGANYGSRQEIATDGDEAPLLPTLMHFGDRHANKN